MSEFLAGKAGCQGCWEYPSAKNGGGYSQYKERGMPCTAHRAAYIVAFGAIPAGLGVLHSCDNPPCCNPAHLFVGTDRDNQADAKAKDRHSRGERNGCSKLTEQQVRAILSDERRQVDIAADHGIRQTTVSEIKRGNRWGHLHAR